MDDLVDLLFTIMVSFFALIFINGMLISGVDERNDDVVERTVDNSELFEFLLSERFNFENGEDIDFSELTEKIKTKQIHIEPPSVEQEELIKNDE